MKLTVQLEDGQFREFIAKSSDTMTEVILPSSIIFDLRIDLKTRSRNLSVHLD